MPTAHVLSASWSEEEKICQVKNREKKKERKEGKRTSSLEKSLLRARSKGR